MIIGSHQRRLRRFEWGRLVLFLSCVEKWSERILSENRAVFLVCHLFVLTSFIEQALPLIDDGRVALLLVLLQGIKGMNFFVDCSRIDEDLLSSYWLTLLSSHSRHSRFVQQCIRVWALLLTNALSVHFVHPVFATAMQCRLHLMKGKWWHFTAHLLMYVRILLDWGLLVRVRPTDVNFTVKTT